MTQNSTEGFRLSPQQTNVWSLQHQTSAAPYRAVCAIELVGCLREDLLKAAADELVRRHEILLTTFQRPPGVKSPFQVVAENLTPAWQILDLSTLDRHEQNESVDSYFAAEHQQPFNLERGPLLTLALLKLSAERHVLIVSLPSLCADSKSLTNIARELDLAYDYVQGHGALTGEP